MPQTVSGFTVPAGSDAVSTIDDTLATFAGQVADALKVKQIVVATTTTQTTTTSTTYVDSGLSASITPTSSSNKILVLVNQQILVNRAANVTAAARVQLLRGATVVQGGTTEQFGVYDNASVDRGVRGYVVMNALDTPATTSALTYKTQMRVEAAGDLLAQYANASSTIILMEVIA